VFIFQTRLLPFGVAQFTVNSSFTDPTATQEFLQAVEKVESCGYAVEWAPKVDEADVTAVWISFAGESVMKTGANVALVHMFILRGLKPRNSLSLNIGGGAAQLGQMVPDIAVYAQGERKTQDGGARARHPGLVIEIEWFDAANIALSKAATYLSDAFYGPDHTRVLEVWVVLIPEVPPVRPTAGLLPDDPVPLGPLVPYDGVLPPGAGTDPPAVVVFFSRNNALYPPSYAPVLWDHLVQVPADSLGGEAFPANFVLSEAFEGKPMFIYCLLQDA